MGAAGIQLLHVVLTGLVAAGVAGLVRAFKWWPEAWRKQKPLSCPVCLAGHGAWLAMLVEFTWPGWKLAVFTYFGSTAVAAWILHQLFPPELDLGLGGDDAER